jgi:hypothetical protein
MHMRVCVTISKTMKQEVQPYYMKIKKITQNFSFRHQKEEYHLEQLQTARRILLK